MKIESTQNKVIKNLAKLHSKKERDQTGLFLVEGLHMIKEAQSAGILEKIYQSDDLEDTGLAPTVLCTQPVLNRLSVQKSDAKYIGVCHKPQRSCTQPERVLILDRIQDPGNLGTLIRSAYSFGIDLMLCSSDCADPTGPKALQSTQGALFHLPVVSGDLLKEIPQLRTQNIPVFGAALHRDSVKLHDLKIPQRFALVIGNEGAGISEEVLSLCDQTVFIEMQQFESLNAAIAGSILMYSFQFPD